MSYEPWMLATIDAEGYNGICDEHIERVAKKLLETGKTEIDYTTFCEDSESVSLIPIILGSMIWRSCKWHYQN